MATNSVEGLIGKRRICEMTADEYRKLVAALRVAMKEKPKDRR
jgi:hypothetical protein